MAKCRRDPVEVLHESVRANHEILKGLNGGSKKVRKQKEKSDQTIGQILNKRAPHLMGGSEFCI
jgi:hypothetical protein